MQDVVAPTHVSRTKRYVSTKCRRFALVETPEIKLMYRPDALIQGANASESVATPADRASINVVEGMHPSGAVAPRQVSRKNIFVFDFVPSVTRFDALD